jgi:hypothetical protein
VCTFHFVCVQIMSAMFRFTVNKRKITDDQLVVAPKKTRKNNVEFAVTEKTKNEDEELINARSLIVTYGNISIENNKLSYPDNAVIKVRNGIVTVASPAADFIDTNSSSRAGRIDFGMFIAVSKKIAKRAINTEELASIKCINNTALVIEAYAGDDLDIHLENNCKMYGRLLGKTKKVKVTALLESKMEAVIVCDEAVLIARDMSHIHNVKIKESATSEAKNRSNIIVEVNKNADTEIKNDNSSQVMYKRE